MSKNIKEIGKELMGKSLNSFHRKTGLTQLDKNNEMQDGILNGILSQVYDAYIEKTEQSNVIHLDGSGNGVVVVDSIEGNTLVNLNQYVNKEEIYTIHPNGWYAQISICDLSLIKTNTNYTLLYDIEIIENNSSWVLGSNTKMVIGQSDLIDSVQGHPSVNHITNNGNETSLWDTPCYSNNKILFNIQSLQSSLTNYFSIRPIYCTQLGKMKQ